MSYKMKISAQQLSVIKLYENYKLYNAIKD